MRSSRSGRGLLLRGAVSFSGQFAPGSSDAGMLRYFGGSRSGTPSLIEYVSPQPVQVSVPDSTSSPFVRGLPPSFKLPRQTGQAKMSRSSRFTVLPPARTFGAPSPPLALGRPQPYLTGEGRDSGAGPTHTQALSLPGRGVGRGTAYRAPTATRVWASACDLYSETYWYADSAATAPCDAAVTVCFSGPEPSVRSPAA